MGQILRFHVQAPAIKGDEYAWAVRDFIPVVRAAFKEHGYAKVENAREEGGTFLLAVRDRLFAVHDDFQVAETDWDFDACGCGWAYALGALHVLGKAGTPRSRVTKALQAAARFSNGVGGTFSYVETRA